MQFYVDKDLELIQFWNYPAAAVTTLFVGVQKHKPMHGFSPNFQDMFNPRGFKAD